MEARDVYGNNSALVPVVCRTCGNVQRLSVVTLQTRREAPCTTCGESMNLIEVTAGLPKVVNVEAPVALVRPVSEFP